jgi:hypothetical protein
MCEGIFNLTWVCYKTHIQSEGDTMAVIGE